MQSCIYNEYSLLYETHDLELICNFLSKKNKTMLYKSRICPIIIQKNIESHIYLNNMIFIYLCRGYQ